MAYARLCALPMKPAPIRAIRSSRIFFRAAYHRWTSEGVAPLLDRPSIKLGVFSMPAHPPHRPYPDVLDEDLEMLVVGGPTGLRRGLARRTLHQHLGEHPGT